MNEKKQQNGIKSKENSIRNILEKLETANTGKDTIIMIVNTVV